MATALKVLNGQLIKRRINCAFSSHFGHALEIASEGDSEVSRPNDVRAISSPDLVEVLRVLVGNSALIRQVIHEDLGSPTLHFDAEDRVRHRIIALFEPGTSEAIV